MRLQPGKQSRVVFLADSLSRDLGRQCGQCGWNGSGRRPLKQTLLSETTKTLGPNIDSKLNYKQRTEIYAKLAYPTLVLQHQVGHYPSEPSLSLSICHTAPSFIWSTNMGTEKISRPYNSSKIRYYDRSSKTVWRHLLVQLKHSQQSHQVTFSAKV